MMMANVACLMAVGGSKVRWVSLLSPLRLVLLLGGRRS